MRTLNFLVPHEVAHVVKMEKSVEAPSIDVSKHEAFDAELVKHYANEVAVDRLALEMARRIYVYGGGLYDEDVRAHISIGAFLAMGNVVRRDFKRGRQFEPPHFARVIAVSRELSKSDAIPIKTKLRLNKLSRAFHKILVGEGYGYSPKDVSSLVADYRRIFRETQLPL